MYGPSFLEKKQLHPQYDSQSKQQICCKTTRHGLKSVHMPEVGTCNISYYEMDKQASQQKNKSSKSWRSLYPCVSFFSAMAGESSGAQVELPQMLGPPTGSMPIKLPQERKRLALVLRGIKRSVMTADMEPNSAVSLISPANIQCSSWSMLCHTMGSAHDWCVRKQRIATL